VKRQKQQSKWILTDYPGNVKRYILRVVVSLIAPGRSHSREGGNPLLDAMFFQGLVQWIPAFAGMTASQEGFRPANDTSTF
jgi:hypothetical protein